MMTALAIRWTLGLAARVIVPSALWKHVGVWVGVALVVSGVYTMIALHYYDKGWRAAEREAQQEIQDINDIRVELDAQLSHLRATEHGRRQEAYDLALTRLRDACTEGSGECPVAPLAPTSHATVASPPTTPNRVNATPVACPSAPASASCALPPGTLAEINRARASVARAKSTK